MEKIALMDPVNKLAAIVTSRGISYTPDKKLNGFHSEFRPVIKRPLN